MPSLAYPLPRLPGFDSPKTYAKWPVWHDSTTKEVKFQPMKKKEAAKLLHKARRFERQTRKAGKQDGAIGRNGMMILQALLFEFLVSAIASRLWEKPGCFSWFTWRRTFAT